MVLRRVRTEGPGVALSAMLTFVLEVASYLWKGGPCNGTRMYRLDELVTGGRCVDRFGPVDPADVAGSLVLCIAAACVGTFVGRDRSALRGAAGVAIGMGVYDLYMNVDPHYPTTIEDLGWAALAAVVSGAIGFAGAWFVARFLPRPRGGSA